MRKNKIFIACDTTDIKKIKRILKETQNKKITFGYKFGLEFLNSKYGRKFVNSLKNKITFGDYKFSDIPNTCSSAIRAIQDLNFNYLTIHISSGLNALKAAKKVSDRLVDYVGISPVYSTSTKHDHKQPIGFDGLAKICAASSVYTVAVGGLKLADCHHVLAAGANGMAVVSAICGQNDPYAASMALATSLASYERH